MSEGEDDPWEKVAKAALAREARREVQPKGPQAASGINHAVCTACGSDQRITEAGTFVVHFPSLAAQRPCIGCWKHPCAACGQLLTPAKTGGGFVHLATGAPECPSPKRP